MAKSMADVLKEQGKVVDSNKVQQGDHVKDAISDYDNAIKLKPDFADAHFNRGLAKANLGQTAKANKDFQTALKLATQTGDIALQNKIQDTLLKLK